ncbi:hypothetical protein ACFLTP_09285 [Chloroflexota bacterium]
MRNKGLDIFLMVLFGVGGIAILLLTLVHPMTISERIPNILFASIGILWVLKIWVPKRVNARQPN